MGLHEEIQKAAYELYEKSGRVGGRDVENWLEAEKAVKAMHAGKEAAPSGAKRLIKAPAVVAEKPKKAARR